MFGISIKKEKETYNIFLIVGRTMVSFFLYLYIPIYFYISFYLVLISPTVVYATYAMYAVCADDANDAKYTPGRVWCVRLHGILFSTPFLLCLMTVLKPAFVRFRLHSIRLQSADVAAETR